MPTFALPTYVAARYRSLGDSVIWLLFIVVATLATMIIFMIVAFLIGESAPLIRQGGVLRFFTDPGWWPKDGSFGMTPMLVSSLLLTLGATILAAPFSISISIFMVFISPSWLSKFIQRLVEASAAIPTVVYGLWGVTVLVPLLNIAHPPGASLLAGIILLALMVLPTITILSSEALRAVPASFIQASSALGISQVDTFIYVVLPTAWPGIGAALVLGAARAIGETIVVLMVCGNIVQLPHSLFDPVRALTSNIALEMPYAMGSHRSSLFVAGLMILLLVTTLVLVRELVLRERSGECGC